MVGDNATFEIDATEVIGTLRTSVAGVLASVDGVRKAVDVQRLFKLDSTLSWQLFQVAGPIRDDAGTLAVGAKVPSRASFKRFLSSAESRGVASAKIERVWSSLERFEQLIETHAGDRTSFVSMVSAAAGLDAEWLAADAQHRRNVFRGLSHIVGVQALCKHDCSLMFDVQGGEPLDMGLVAGYVGLRTLRTLPSTLVFRVRWVDSAFRPHVRRVGLGPDAAVAGGYLMPAFSTDPLPNLATRELDAGWLVTELLRPDVGNLGACTLRFGTAYYRDGPRDPDERRSGSRIDVVVDHPVEVLIHDTLLAPGLMGDATPVADVFLGTSHADTPALPGGLVPVLGDHRVEFLGKGPDALTTPDVPQYPDLVRAAAAKLGRDVERFDAYRVRLEFPVYQSTVSLRWVADDAKRER